MNLTSFLLNSLIFVFGKENGALVIICISIGRPSAEPRTVFRTPAVVVFHACF